MNLREVMSVIVFVTFNLGQATTHYYEPSRDNPAAKQVSLRMVRHGIYPTKADRDAYISGQDVVDGSGRSVLAQRFRSSFVAYLSYKGGAYFTLLLLLKGADFNCDN